MTKLIRRGIGFFNRVYDKLRYQKPSNTFHRLGSTYGGWWIETADLNVHSKIISAGVGEDEIKHALLLLIRREEIDWTAKPPEIDIPMQKVSQLYRDHLRNGKMNIDSYVLDIRTRGGRRGPGSLTRLALEGTLVKNEETKFRHREYRAINIFLMKELDHLNSLCSKMI